MDEQSVVEIESIETYLERVQAHAASFRVLLVDAKKFFKAEKQETFEDQRRALKLAQDHAQTGYMWLRRGASNQKGF